MRGTRTVGGLMAIIAATVPVMVAGVVVGAVDSGQLVPVIDGQRTMSPGRVVIRRSFTLTQRLAGGDGDIVLAHPKHGSFARGDTVCVVDTQTDGDSYVNDIWTYRGHEDTTAAFWPDRDDPPDSARRGVTLDREYLRSGWSA